MGRRQVMGIGDFYVIVSGASNNLLLEDNTDLLLEDGTTLDLE